MVTSSVELGLEEISKIFNEQHKRSRDARGFTFEKRKSLLKAFGRLIAENRDLFYEALRKDLRKSESETITSEVEYLLRNLAFVERNLADWMEPEKVPGSILSFPSTARRIPEPFGTTLIISPWNYPLQLALAPAIAAIAAGNRVILKPSEFTPHTTNAIHKCINKYFDASEVACIPGGIETSTSLLSMPFDKIFFTGSPKVGKIVMRAAANHLSNVTLELGGKSPCIIDTSANIKVAARRIAHGKFYNTGQTCIAPDYVLIHSDKKNEFIEEFKKATIGFYGTNPEQSKDYGRVVHEGHWDHLDKLIKGEADVQSIGKSNRDELFFAPTLVIDPSMESDIMQTEIFGPVLPVVGYSKIEEALEKVRSLPNPLSLYCFSENKKFKEEIIRSLHFGGGMVNDTLEHFVNHNLPFGGKGESGIGMYHGKYSFDCFTHYKSVAEKGTTLDLPLKYPPFGKKLGLLRWIYKWF